MLLRNVTGCYTNIRHGIDSQVVLLTFSEKFANLVFDEILTFQNLSEMVNVKKLKGESDTYRIRIGDYRIGFFVQGETITFARVLHRREFYRYFP